MDSDIQNIILVGHLLTDAQSYTDKNGHDYIRFKMSCRRTTYTGETKFTIYRICCYQSGFENLRQGDQVYVSGDLDITYHVDENGKAWLNNDVFARQITKGSTENQKIKKNNRR